MEGPEKLFGGPVQAGPSGYLQAAALLDELPVQQQADGIGAVHTPDLIHIGPGGGLVVGDDGQHLQRRLAELGGLADLKGFSDHIRVVRRGTQLPGILHAQQPDAPRS